jgi:uncharacterized protein YndB with AHSA1/START domain
MTTQSITVDQFIAAAPQQVWEAISTPEGLAKWWVPGNIEPVVGHEFLLEMPGWGNVACRVLEVETDRLLVYTFTDWTLRWTITSEGKGTRLILEHSGFDLDNPQHRFAFDTMGPGWTDEVLPRLAATVEHDSITR